MSQVGSEPGPIVLAPATLPLWLRRAIALLGGAYVFFVYAGNVSDKLRQILPPVPRFFTQTACLFPHAAINAIEWRLEGYDCEPREFRALDVRPYFGMHAENKESRLHRVAGFYRNDRKVMEALERYVLALHNERAQTEPGLRPIGGIRVVSVRRVLPKPGEAVERFRWRALDEYPKEQHKHWFFTPESRRRKHCAALSGGQ